jgi:hypothetical protein
LCIYSCFQDRGAHFGERVVVVVGQLIVGQGQLFSNGSFGSELLDENHRGFA